MNLLQLMKPCKTDVFVKIYVNHRFFDGRYARDFYYLYHHNLRKYQVMMIDCDEDGLRIYVKEVKQND